MKERIVLGINDGHNASACIIKNGRILGAVSEERLNRIKNYSDFPFLSIKELFGMCSISPSQIDLIGFSSKDILPFNRREILERGTDNRIEVAGFNLITRTFPMSITEGILTKLATIGRTYLKRRVYNLRYRKLLKELGLGDKRVIFYDHHTVHAYTAYYLNPFKQKKVLVFTCDGEGDGLCATVSIGEDNILRREVSIPFVHSLGKMYNEVTWYLGLKPWEDEYKVMGLAAYVREEYVAKTWKYFKDNIVIDKRDPRKFRNNLRRWGPSYHSYLRKNLDRHRFDTIAYCIQRLLEEILVKWISNCVRYYDINDVAGCGGVFMNVKANQRIMEIPDVRSLFVFPSADDESSSIGASIMGYIDLCSEDGIKPEIQAIGPLYLGPSYQVDEVIRNIDKTKYKVEKFSDIEGAVGDLLTKEKIVANFHGGMEFGARALGNRSILANPSSLKVVKEINEAIKHRDFWMPFAPTILRERVSDYIVEPKLVDDQYMIITMDANNNSSSNQIIATLHQFDGTCRPQVLDATWNARYHRIIKNFESVTGIGGILNTSFNLHGEPIVCKPSDAISTLERSGLRYLRLDNYLIEKV